MVNLDDVREEFEENYSDVKEQVAKEYAASQAEDVDPEDAISKYHADELDEVYDVLMDEIEHLDYSYEEKCASAIVAANRIAKYPLLPGTVAEDMGVDEETVKELVEYISENSVLVVDRDIGKESYEEYIFNYISTQNVSDDFEKAIKTHVQEHMYEDTEPSSAMEEKGYSDKVISAVLCYISGNETAWNMDDVGFDEVSKIHDVSKWDVMEAYHECWHKKGYKLVDHAIDPSGVLNKVKNILEDLDVDDSLEDVCIYYTYEYSDAYKSEEEEARRDEEYENEFEYNTDAIASHLVASSLPYEYDDVTTNPARARRIGNKIPFEN